MSSLGSPRASHSPRTTRVKGARRLAAFIAALCVFAASASFFHTRVYSAGDAYRWPADFVKAAARGASMTGALAPAPAVSTGAVASATYGGGAVSAQGVLQYRTVANGNWNSTSTWEASPDGANWIPALTTPTSADGAITIRSGHTVTVTAPVTADELTVNNGGILLINTGVTFTINDDAAGTDLTVDGPSGLVGTAGTITNNGQAQINGVLRIDDGGFPGTTGTYSYDQTTGSLVFNNTTASYGVNSDHTYWPDTNGPQNVSIGSGGVTMNVARTVGLTCQTSGPITHASNLTFDGLFVIFNFGGSVDSAPTYGNSSTLEYTATGPGTYHRASEWLAVTSGAGYPHNVHVGGNTTLDIANGATFNTAPSQMSGSLTVDSGSALSMGAMTQPLTVLGDASVNGTLTLSTASQPQPLNVGGNLNLVGTLTLSPSNGGDLKLGGNWTRDANATFTPNSRAVFFNGSGAQTVTVTGGGTQAFDYLVVDKSGGNLSPAALTNLSVTQTAGNVLQLVNAGGIDLNGQTLTLSGDGGSVLASGGARTVTGTGTFSFNGSKSVTGASSGTLTFDTGVTVTTSAGVDFGSGLSTLKGTLSIKANGSVSTNPPTYDTGSTLEYDNGTSYDASAEFPATGVQNVRLASTTQLNLNGDKSIAGTFDAGTRAVGTTGASPFSLSADSITVSTGTLNLNNVTTATAFSASGAAGVNVAGNWNVAGFSAGTSTVNFDGTAAQSIQTASAFNNLTASNDISLGASPSVGGLLALGSHKITTGANTLTIGGAGSVTRGTNGYIIGTEQKSFSAGGSFTFDVGTANGYSPVDANSTTGTGTLAVKPTQTRQPNVSGANALARYWTLTGAGVTTNLTFHYLAGDVTSGTEANFKIFRYNGSTFTAFTPTTLDATNHFATLNNVSSFSDWTLAESSAVFGQIQFAQANTSTPEGNAGTQAVNIAVQRVGGASGAVSVDYSVTDGTATAGSDYSVSPASGTLNWADGDNADKTITITVNGDNTPEPDETVNLSLSNPTGGAVLGSPTSATLTIANDDPPSTVYVDDDWANLTPGTDPDGAGPATAIGFDAFSTIQAGVNAVAAAGTVNVAAGTYPENVTVGKAATLLGANANVAGSAARGAESIVRTNGNQVAVFSVSADNVTINGFTIDGDDPSVAGGALASGDDANVQYGVRPTGAFNHVTVRDNIIKHVAIGFRGDGVSQNNLVAENWFDSVGNFDFGYAVSLRTNYYADVTDNKMTRVWTGVHTNNFFAAGGPATWTMSGNEVHSYAGGLLYWLEYQNATGLTVNNNQFSAESGAVANNFGVLFVSIQDAVNPSFTNNTITGHNYGVGLFNVPTSNHVTLGATNSIANSTLAGVLLTDNLNFNPVGTTNFLAGGPGAASTVNVTGLSVTGNTGDGLKVVGTTNAQTLSVTGANVAGNSGTRGLEAVGPHAAASVNGSAITGFATGVSLQNSGGGSLSVNAHFNRIVSATNAIDNPNNQTVNLENNWWGCNAGPGGAGCGAVTGTGADFNPWLVLAVSASPNTITPGGTSTVTADLTHNSDAADTSAGGFIPATPVSFGATQGTVFPTGGTLTSGQATTTFTSTSGSAGTASATVDNQTANTNIDVTAPAFSFSVTNVSQAEGDAGTTDFTFTVTKTGATALGATVDYATADGTATGGTCGAAGVDYASKSGTLTFASGDTSMDIVVKVCGDTTYEANETFTVTLSNPSGATIANGQGVATGTIQNDDAPPTTLYVNSTADTDDGFCSTAPGGCTLREAIGAANFAPDLNNIYFQIPAATDAGCNVSTGVCTIAPGPTNLPVVTTPVNIDGYTQVPCANNSAPCSHPNTLATGDDAVILIQLDGTNVSTNGRGLDLRGGSSTVRGLVINRFNQFGVYLQDNGGDTISGNFIGTDTAGATALANAGGGITLNDTSNNTVGGATPADRNVISGNGGDGVDIPSATATLNTLTSNYIGTNAAGTAALGNTNHGVYIQAGANHNTVGCSEPSERNVISGNGNSGVFIDGSTTTANVVTGNYLGVGADGTTAVANGSRGVLINDASNSQIGGVNTGEGNVIAGNSGVGVRVQGSGTGNSVRGNSIHDNASLGIDLGADGVNANDDQDTDTGANNLQNFPVITSAKVTGNTVNVAGTLNSTPGQTFTIDFYSNASCDASGSGEGQTYLGSLTTDPTDTNGDVSFTFHPTPQTLSAGQVVTATAIDANGNTSEFSQCFTAVAGTPGQIQFTDATYTVAENGTSAAITFTRSGGSDGVVYATFSTSDGTATAGSDYTATAANVSYADGETGTKTVYVPVTDDSVYEGNETVNLALTATTLDVPPPPNSPAQSTATLTINEDDAAPTLEIDDVTANEGDGGPTVFTFHVKKTGATALHTTVNYATADGTATQPSDYAAKSGSLDFPPSSTTDTQDIAVTVNGDTTVEADETFTVTLSDEQNATVTKRVGTGTIVNDDADYTVTTGATIVVTDDTGNGDALDISEPAAGFIKFAAPGRVFRVNGSTLITGDSGNLPLSNVGQITVNQGGGDDTANVGAFTYALPNLTINGDAGDDTVNFKGSITFAPDANLDVNLQDDTATPGTDSVSVSNDTQGAHIITSGAGTIDVRASKNVTVGVGGSLQTENGALTVEANQQASATAGNFNGVDIVGGSIQATGSGVVSIKGAGGTGGTVTRGVNVAGGGAITSKDGQTTVTGTGGDGADNAGINLASTGTALVQTTGTGSILLVADRMTFDPSNASVNAGPNSVTLRQKTAGTLVDLGSTTDAAAGTLELSDGELDRVSAATLNVGDAGSGAITVSAAITRPAPTAINLTSGGAININASSLDSGGGNVTLAPGSSSSVNPAASGTDVSMSRSSTLSFAPGSDLAVAINGTTADTQYTQLNVVGRVDLTGVDLVLSGSDTVAAGQHFVVVNNDGVEAITGNFNGLPEGATIPDFLGSGFDAQITYSGGDGNDCVITVKPRPVFSINNVSMNEGDAGQTHFTFTITKTGDLATLHSAVQVDTADGTASAPSDYTAVTSLVVDFAPGELSKPVTVEVNGDATYEHDENFFVNLSNPVRATIDPDHAQGTGTIQNDDAKPSISITPAVTQAEGTGNTPTPFVFTVTKTGATDLNAAVSYATADGTATGATQRVGCGLGADYVSQSGTLTFLPNETTKTITVPVCADSTYEANETFFVNLTNQTPDDLTLSNNQGVGTISNDDKPPQALLVNTTDDANSGFCLAEHCSLREAIVAANANPDANTINFLIPAGDPGHFYYADDGVAGQLTHDGNHVLNTSASDDSAIGDIDPDWKHSWWTISPLTPLPAITSAVTINGYTQPGAAANTSASADNAVLRVEINGAGAGVSANGLTLGGGGSTLEGLIVNRFGGHGVNVASGNDTVAGNFVGTDASGTLALANGGSGLSSSNEFSNLFGGATADARNVVSGNTGDGVTLAGCNSTTVQGNFIGTKADGSGALGNGANGVAFSTGSVFNTVGGVNQGEANTIAFNGGDGVQVDSTSGPGHSVRGNSIHDNGAASNNLGIDLGPDGVTANDDKDADSGPNGLQNFPVITSVLVTGSTKTITGTLNSKPNQTFVIDFYSNTSCDASGNGEGQTYLGSVTTGPTDSVSGDVSFTFHPTALALGQVVTATATATAPAVFGSTSEFSQCASATTGDAGTIQFKQSNYRVAENGGVAHITVQRVGGNAGIISATFSTSDGTATVADNDYQPVAGTTVTFNDGDTADKTVDVTVNDDTVYEAAETVNLSLSGTNINRPVTQNGPLDPVAGTSATLTITNDDTPPTLSIGDATENEGDNGTTAFTFTVTRSGNSTEVAASANYATQNGTAVAPGDYQSASGTVTVPANQTTATVTVLVNGDTTQEPDETFTVHLSSPTDATIAGADGTGTIKNDDGAPTFSVGNVQHAEGNAGTTDFTFTVTKAGATAFDTSVDYATSDGTATTADGDYLSASGTLTFSPSETTKTFTVHVNGDTKPELDETFNVALSHPLGATIPNGQGTGTGTIQNDDESVSAGQLVISEFRLRGPGATPTPGPTPGAPVQSDGPATSVTKKQAAISSAAVDTSPQANDEFVELYNNTDSPLLVTTTDGSKGWAVAASDGVVRFVVPNGTTIPARGHFLGVNKLGYSLSAYPAGNDGANLTTAAGDPILLGDGTPDTGYTRDIPDNAGIAVFRTATPASFSTTTRLDAAGSTSESNTLYKEGAGYPALSPTDIAQNLNYSFYRNLCDLQPNSTCASNNPKDTGDNAADFLFVDTKGTLTAAGQRLGAPGPENLSSHVQRNALIPGVVLDTSKSLTLPPNRFRDPTPNTPSASVATFGTLSVRRRFTNNTGSPVTQLRFRIVELTTFPAPAGTADLRAISSAQVSVSNVGDADTCGGATPCTVTVEGTTVEEPPAQLSAMNGANDGGGYNTSLGVGAISLAHPLAPGASVNVQFLLGVRQTGNFRILVNVEAKQ